VITAHLLNYSGGLLCDLRTPGMLLMLIVLPFYVGCLMQRMNDATLKTEQELKECRERNLRWN
jgi:hypothetical protein